MPKVYIASVNAPQAHASDILDVAITNRYTITVSSDGCANYWDNYQKENHNPFDFVLKKFVHKTGIHHVAVYENVMPDSTIKLVVVAFVCFDGSIVFHYYTNDDASTLQVLENHSFKKDYWAPAFYKDPVSKQDYFVVTQATGPTSVNFLNITIGKDNAVDIKFEKAGELTTHKSVFPNSLAVTRSDDLLAAVGYANGDVYVYDLKLMRTLYTFRSTDLVVETKGGNSVAMPRVLKFSNDSKFLAVARDNQASGSITLYDVKFGEYIGNLTSQNITINNVIGGFAHSGWIMGLSFDEHSTLLASCGFDKCVRIWNLESREREATINLTLSDSVDTPFDEQFDKCVASGVAFIKSGIRGGPGKDNNESLCVISFDRGVRWYREAGGV
ncbi:hypothetical protein G9P44_003427 [Scheffersomyces stipitis]|nr:hypothetical protein G9P44_003427 [Scheffersomyces stipitis]